MGGERGDISRLGMHAMQARWSVLSERVVEHHQLHTVSQGVSIPRNTIRPPRHGVVSRRYGFASAYSLAPPCPSRPAAVGGPQTY